MFNTTENAALEVCCSVSYGRVCWASQHVYVGCTEFTFYTVNETFPCFLSSLNRRQEFVTVLFCVLLRLIQLVSEDCIVVYFAAVIGYLELLPFLDSYVSVVLS